jgi:hypothetical protein
MFQCSPEDLKKILELFGYKLHLQDAYNWAMIRGSETPVIIPKSGDVVSIEALNSVSHESEWPRDPQESPRIRPDNFAPAHTEKHSGVDHTWTFPEVFMSHIHWNVGVRQMSEQEHTVPIEDIDREMPTTDLAQLTELARQAYHQKRTKNCLDLVKNILLMDPENAEAQLMRSSIRMEMHLDLENARTLLRDAHLKDKPQMYSEAGSTVLRKILSIDPESEEAKTLLSEVEGFVPAPLPVLPPPPSAALPEPSPAPVVEQRSVMESLRALHRKRPRPNRRWVPAVVAILPVVLTVFGLLWLRSRTAENGELTAVAASTQVEKPEAITLSPVPWTAGGKAQPDPTPIPPPAAVPAVNVVDSAPAAPVISRPETRPAPEPVVTSPGGKLAVSSSTSVDIYRGDQYIGSAPITIDISPGVYTFEYRHEGMVKTVTHTIGSNETTRAMISFDVPVQINARPWADVSIDGTVMKPLGQTPMSNVRVPIGGILVFQNPKFPTKRYRVTGKESTIQIVFP